MFRNLNAELARNNMTIKDLAAKTNIKYESLKNKLSGVTEFKRSEMISIKKEFPQCTLDYLFATEEPVEV
jgi:predicted transcriptional regulator